jgi:hypothetical protein
MYFPIKQLVFELTEVQTALQSPLVPLPTVFIFDIASHFYPQVKAAVEANFKGIEIPKLVAYSPWSTGELI